MNIRQAYGGHCPEDMLQLGRQKPDALSFGSISGAVCFHSTIAAIWQLHVLVWLGIFWLFGETNIQEKKPKWCQTK